MWQDEYAGNFHTMKTKETGHVQVKGKMQVKKKIEKGRKNH